MALLSYINMLRFFVLFVFIQLLVISNSSFAQDVNPVYTLSDENFGWKDVDTVYYKSDGKSIAIHKIIYKGHVSEFYQSGNLKATGQVVKKKCEKIYDSTGSHVLHELCDFSLEGEWNIYYDIHESRIAAIAKFRNNKWISRLLIAENGCVYQKEQVDRKLIKIEKYDENCQLTEKELIFPFQGDGLILRKIKFQDNKVVEEKSKSDLTVFVAKYYDVFAAIILFFALAKFVLCFFYFQNFYKNNETVNGIRRSLLVSFIGTFTLFISVNRNNENYFMARVHNCISIVFLILSIFFFYNLYII